KIGFTAPAKVAAAEKRTAAYSQYNCRQMALPSKVCPPNKPLPSKPLAFPSQREKPKWVAENWTRVIVHDSQTPLSSSTQMCPNTKGCHESFTGHPDGEIMSPGPKATRNTNSSTVPYHDVTTALFVGEK
ncbi:unnamed protein product, partial [Ectocarpus sp. 8 AP-2014]